MLYLLLFQQDWLSDTVGRALVGQAIIGVISLIGLIAVLRRFLVTEFPAAMRQVNDRLDILHKDFESFEREFRHTQLEVERLKERVDNLRTRQQDLDDTGSRMRGRSPQK